MKTLLGKYQNGNYTTRIYDDGTRIRETDEDYFNPFFAECIDMQISNRCNNGCEWCYAGCAPDGKIADLKTYTDFYDSIHPYTELAININFPLSDDFEWFLDYMKNRNVIVNATIAQKDFMEYHDYVYYLIKKYLIKGIGVSYCYPDKRFIDIAQSYTNLILHVICGIFTEHDIKVLGDKGFKILILGYKDMGRGTEYHKEALEKITDNQYWLYNNICDVIDKFDVVSFDNLALEQLDIKRLFNDEDWDKFYSGDDGQFTYYLDLVNETFSINSLSEPIGDMIDNTDEMFNIVKNTCQNMLYNSKNKE